ncbi:MAG: hypothetical protein ABSD98_10275 [Candidatus Korobacteraceae bacterium]|jgi:hypothetical protein
MTCREFKHGAASLTLWELLRTQDERILNHAQQCESCGGWLREQRTLSASLKTLQAQTASLQAGPDVERTLLRAFRQTTAGSAAFAGFPSNAEFAASPDAVEEHVSPLRSIVARVSAPVALRLSHFFEVGAYVAVAAAIIVSVFLGVRLLQHSSRTVPVQSRIPPGSTRPLLQKPVIAAQENSSKLAPVVTNKHVTSGARRRIQRSAAASIATATTQTVAADESQTDADAGYIALMFCDPLSCSSDTQVVRMELPARGAGQNSQPQMADVVVGYDGVVRAVRIVN